MLPKFAPIKKQFYLAGGTAVALQIEHRDSVDFDFFTEHEFNNAELLALLQSQFRTENIKVTQELPNTLTALIMGVSASFFVYKYPLIEPTVDTEYLRLASIADVGAMKLGAILSRHVFKDYVDLYVICKQIPLPELCAYAKRKYPNVDIGVYLRSLSYLADVEEEKLLFYNGFSVTLAEIEKFFAAEIKKMIST